MRVERRSGKCNEPDDPVINALAARGPELRSSRLVLYCEGALELRLGISRNVGREAFGLCSWIVRTVDERLRLEMEEARQDDHRSFTGISHARFKMRHSRSRHSQTFGQLRLRPAPIRTQRSNASAEAFR